MRPPDHLGDRSLRFIDGRSHVYTQSIRIDSPMVKHSTIWSGGPRFKPGLWEHIGLARCVTAHLVDCNCYDLFVWRRAGTGCRTALEERTVSRPQLSAMNLRIFL